MVLIISIAMMIIVIFCIASSTDSENPKNHNKRYSDSYLRELEAERLLDDEFDEEEMEDEYLSRNSHRNPKPRKSSSFNNAPYYTMTPDEIESNMQDIYDEGEAFFDGEEDDGF